MLKYKENVYANYWCTYASVQYADISDGKQRLWHIGIVSNINKSHFPKKKLKVEDHPHIKELTRTGVPWGGKKQKRKIRLRIFYRTLLRKCRWQNPSWGTKAFKPQISVQLGVNLYHISYMQFSGTRLLPTHFTS